MLNQKLVQQRAIQGSSVSGLNHTFSVYEEGARDTPHLVRPRYLTLVIQQDGECESFGLDECLDLIPTLTDTD